METLENKAAHQQPGNHPDKKTSEQAFEDTSEASSHIGGNGQHSINSSKTHKPIISHIINNIYEEHTHNDRYIDKHNILNAYNHARRADDMRR